MAGHKALISLREMNTVAAPKLRSMLAGEHDHFQTNANSLKPSCRKSARGALDELGRNLRKDVEEVCRQAEAVGQETDAWLAQYKARQEMKQKDFSDGLIYKTRDDALATEAQHSLRSCS